MELFFVLSGFLISSILWRGRLAVRAGAASASGVWKRFLLRRTLRIFPPYYLLIAVALVAGLGITASNAKWFVSYLSNVYIVRRGDMTGPTVPLWSLAVEEQFYLLWPALLLFLPRRAIAALLAAAVVLSPAYRVLSLHRGEWGAHLLLPGCLDLFALGAVLGILGVEASPRRRTFERVSLPIAAILGLAAFASPADFQRPLARSAMGFLTVALVGGADRGFRGPGRRLLESRPVVYVGKISYGIYLYHTFVAVAAARLLGARAVGRIPLPLHGLLFSALAVGCAALSWRFLEAPIARWKERIGSPSTAPPVRE